MKFTHLCVFMGVLFFAMVLIGVMGGLEYLGWFNASLWAFICAIREETK